MEKETLEQFMARGGEITIIPKKPEYFARTSRYHFRDLESPAATAPGGWIEPRLRTKSWPNRKKKRSLRPVGKYGLSGR